MENKNIFQIKIPNKTKNIQPWIHTIMLVLFVIKTYFKVEIPKEDELINLILITGSAWGIWRNF